MNGFALTHGGEHLGEIIQRWLILPIGFSLVWWSWGKEMLDLGISLISE